MRGFGFFKSKKYFQRVLFSIMLAMALILTSLALANAYILERSVKDAQRDSSLKVLSQLQYNLAYMNEIISHLSSFSFRDNYLVPLLFSDPLPMMDYIRGYNEMAKIMESSSFLHSIAVYNARSGELFGSTGEFLVDGGETKARMMKWLLETPGLQTSRLIPVSLDDDDSVDAFAFLVADTFKPFSKAESSLIFYIKPDWVFDSLRRVNDAGAAQGEIYIRMPDGRLLSGNESSLDPSKISGIIERGRSDAGFVVADTGREKSAVTYMEGIGDWTILYVQPYDALMKDVTKVRERSLLVAAAFLLLAIGLSVWLSYKLYRPIETMLSRIRPHLGDARRSAAQARDELDSASDNVRHLSERLQEIGAEQIVRKYYLRKWLTDSGLFSEDDRRQLIAKHGLNVLPEGPLSVCVLRIDKFLAYDRAHPPATKKLHGFAVANIAQELMGAAYPCEAIDIQSDHVVLIVSGPGEDEGGGRIKEQAERILETVERYYRISLSCGIADAVPRLSQLSAAYLQADRLSRYMFARGYRSVIAPSDVREEAAGALPPDIERRLAEALKKGQLASAGAELERAFSLLTAFPYDDMRRAVSDLAWTIQRAAEDITNNRLHALSIDPERLRAMTEDNETLEDRYVSMLAACAAICDNRKPTGMERNEMIVASIKELIDQQYPDPNLSQQSVASTIKLTSAYTGKLFKDACGMTMTEYINDVRLERARALLLQTDKTIAEIMERCGYANQSYFFRLFKGKYGATPKEYRLKKALS